MNEILNTKFELRRKKGFFPLAVLIFTIISFILVSTPSQAQPHWVAGKVINAADGTDVAWRTVHIYYPGDSGNFVGCLVGPETNFFFCDSTDIPGHTWQVGDILNAEVIDLGDGYYAGPVSFTTTGGRDVAPEMTLMYLVDITSPSNITYTESTITLSVTTKSEYSNSIWYTLDSSDNVALCSNCNEATATLDLDDGQYLLEVFADDSSGNVVSKQVYFVVDTFGDPSGAAPGLPGGGAGARFEEKYIVIDPDKPVVFTLLIKTEEYTGITELIVFVKNKVNDVGITVTKLEGRPAFVRPTSGTAYVYHRIDTVNLPDISIEKSLIKFRIDQPWFEENDYDKETIALLRYNKAERKWEELKTSKVNENKKFVFYESESPGLSIFAIRAMQLPKEVRFPLIGGYTKIYSSFILVALVLIILIIVAVIIQRARRNSK